MSGLWYSAPPAGKVGGTARRLRQGAGLALVFAGVLATGAVSGAWGDGGRLRTDGTDMTVDHVSAATGRSEALRARSGGGAGDAEELVSRSGDRWSAAYTAREYEGLRSALDGRYVGVGLSVRRGHDAEGAPVVDIARVRHGSPAAHAGLLPGDRLRAVDGRRVAGRPVTDVVARLRGPADGAGSPVDVSVSRDGRDWTRTLHRARLSTDAVTVDRTGRGTTRIKVTAFTKGSGEQVRRAVASSVPEDGGIVLDLRGNSGGLVTEAATAASAFLDGGLVATYDAHGAQRALYAESDGPDPVGNAERPLVVLVDSGTMSAAELLTGALQDRGRAVVVGSRTFGKGSVQMPRELPDGSVAELTVGHYATPSGRKLDGEGITPDLAVSDPARAAERARTVLSGLETRS